MGIYVPGLKIPQNCISCPFFHRLGCSAVPDFPWVTIFKDHRPEWCPLEEREDKNE